MIAISSKQGIMMSLEKIDARTIIELHGNASAAEYFLTALTEYMRKLPEIKPEDDACKILEQGMRELVTLLNKAGRKDIAITEVQKDYSFDEFWEAYAYKVGKKERVRRRWEAMGRVERTMAMQHIRKYNYFLSTNPGIQRKYPETYLNAEEWNN